MLAGWFGDQTLSKRDQEHRRAEYAKRVVIPHHQGAIDMAETVLKFGRDPQNQHFAHEIIDTQTREIAEMRAWLRQRGLAEP